MWTTSVPLKNDTNKGKDQEEQRTTEVQQNVKTTRKQTNLEYRLTCPCCCKNRNSPSVDLLCSLLVLDRKKRRTTTCFIARGNSTLPTPSRKQWRKEGIDWTLYRLLCNRLQTKLPRQENLEIKLIQAQYLHGIIVNISLPICFRTFATRRRDRWWRKWRATEITFVYELKGGRRVRLCAHGCDTSDLNPCI